MGGAIGGPLFGLALAGRMYGKEDVEWAIKVGSFWGISLRLMLWIGRREVRLLGLLRGC